MKIITQNTQLQILFISLLFFTTTVFAQVGIGTNNPNPNALLDINASTNVGGLLLPRVTLTSTSSFAPLAAHVQGMTIYNTVTLNDVTPGQYYNDGTRWIRVERTTPIQSVTYANDISIGKNTPGGAPPAYANIAGMSLTFTASKTSVFVNFTASGLGYTNSMSSVHFRILNGATSIGGTMSKIQSYDNATGTVTTWSLAFSKPLTGLTIGTQYTLQLQGYAYGILGNQNAVINANSDSDNNHMTLTVIQ